MRSRAAGSLLRAPGQDIHGVGQRGGRAHQQSFCRSVGAPTQLPHLPHLAAVMQPGRGSTHSSGNSSHAQCNAATWACESTACGDAAQQQHSVDVAHASCQPWQALQNLVAFARSLCLGYAPQVMHAKSCDAIAPAALQPTCSHRVS